MWSDNQIKALCQNIVIRAIKDYQYPQYKKQVMDWVVNMDGYFPFVSESMGFSTYFLREIMVDKMIQIDTYGTTSLYIHGETRMCK